MLPGPQQTERIPFEGISMLAVMNMHAAAALLPCAPLRGLPAGVSLGFYQECAQDGSLFCATPARGADLQILMTGFSMSIRLDISGKEGFHCLYLTIKAGHHEPLQILGVLLHFVGCMPQRHQGDYSAPWAPCSMFNSLDLSVSLNYNKGGFQSFLTVRFTCTRCRCVVDTKFPYCLSRSPSQAIKIPSKGIKVTKFFEIHHQTNELLLASCMRLWQSLCLLPLGIEVTLQSFTLSSGLNIVGQATRKHAAHAQQLGYKVHAF